MRRRYISRSAGRSRSRRLKFVSVFFSAGLCLLIASGAHAAPAQPSTAAPESSPIWKKFEDSTVKQEREDRYNGLSYIISGSIAVASGFAGGEITNDPVEKGVYTVFQSIGIAAIGYGAYTWTVGNDDRLMYSALKDSKLSPRERSAVLQSYWLHKQRRERNERIVKAVTHGLISGFNFFNASRQDPGPVRNAMFFIGGVNALACISYSF